MKKIILGVSLTLVAAIAMADKVTVPIYETDKLEQGKKLGTIDFIDTQYGLLIEPNLKGLPPGLHGMHIHQTPSCKHMGMAAGGHYDPGKTDKHLGPRNTAGHKGDLPVLDVSKEGVTDMPMLAPRLTVKEIKDRAVIIHAGGDNYSDKPKKLGGGGARIACGVVR